MKFLVLLSLFFFVSTGYSKEFKGVQFPDEVVVANSKLKLNGIGVRKAMSIVEVYFAALYVSQNSNNPDEILNLKTPKQLIMNFRRFVEKGKLQEAWTEGFGKNRVSGYSYRKDLNKLNSLMMHMKENEKMVITFFEDRAEIQVKDSPVETITGTEFSKTLLSVFIKDPPDSNLKKGILGLSK